MQMQDRGDSEILLTLLGDNRVKPSNVGTKARNMARHRRKGIFSIVVSTYCA